MSSVEGRVIVVDEGTCPEPDHPEFWERSCHPFDPSMFRGFDQDIIDRIPERKGPKMGWLELYSFGEPRGRWIPDGMRVSLNEKGFIKDLDASFDLVVL